jgi:hypothetical protein
MQLEWLYITIDARKLSSQQRTSECGIKARVKAASLNFCTALSGMWAHGLEAVVEEYLFAMCTRKLRRGGELACFRLRAYYRSNHISSVWKPSPLIDDMALTKDLKIVECDEAGKVTASYYESESGDGSTGARVDMIVRSFLLVLVALY